MKILDSFITWAIILAIVAVLASGQTAQFVSTVAQLLQSMIKLITAPSAGSSQ